MSAYNSLNGEWCGQNRRLLTTILKERWGFDGFVVSDWVFGIRDGVAAVNAGLDLEMPARIFVDDRVSKAVKRGLVPQARIDDAALRLVRQQLRFAAVGDGEYGPRSSPATSIGRSPGRRPRRASCSCATKRWGPATPPSGPRFRRRRTSQRDASCHSTRGGCSVWP